jgi:hypothetical protein
LAAGQCDDRARNGKKKPTARVEPWVKKEGFSGYWPGQTLASSFWKESQLLTDVERGAPK